MHVLLLLTVLPSLREGFIWTKRSWPCHSTMFAMLRKQYASRTHCNISNFIWNIFKPGASVQHWSNWYCAPFRLGAWKCNACTGVVIWRTSFCLPLCSLFLFGFCRQWNKRESSNILMICSGLSSRDSAIGCLTRIKHMVFFSWHHLNLNVVK